MEKLLMRARLGDILLERGLIDKSALGHALAKHTRCASRLGDVLTSSTDINYLTLYTALAEQQGLPFINLLGELPDPALLHEAEANVYLRLKAIPWRKQNDTAIIAVCDASPEVLGWIKQRFGDDTQLAITSPLDIRRTVEKYFGAALEAASRLQLWQESPDASARFMMPTQAYLFWPLLCSVAALFFFAPAASLFAAIILCQIEFAATMLFKLWVFAHSTPPLIGPHWQRRLASLHERDLPVYTVLVPMFKEAATMPKLITGLKRLDYPAAKLDIKLVLEHSDTETLKAIHALKPDYRFDIIRVPPNKLQTKPRACNYAMRFARGEYITVFDADDQPDRLQLKKAVYTFRHAPKNVACLQARLNYYNTNDNWLTRLFSLEYTMLFSFMLYGLERLGIPLPLGGTSNHMSVARLRELGEWDPYNVTEDADLGTRIAARGLRTMMFDSSTMEEATNRVKPWVCQRSRWIKGYMQTWLVHMRHPHQLYRTLGFKGFIGFQCFIGLSSLTFLIAPLMWTLTLVWWLVPAGFIPITLPRNVATLCWANLTFYSVLQWYMSFTCAKRYRKHTLSMFLMALAYPFYPILHSIASYKGLWQLIMKPHFWEKTTHGLAHAGHLLASEEELLKNGEIPVDNAPKGNVKVPLSAPAAPAFTVKGYAYESSQFPQIRQEA